MANEIEKYNNEVDAVFKNPKLQVHEKLIEALNIASKYNFKKNDKRTNLKKGDNAS